MKEKILRVGLAKDLGNTFFIEDCLTTETEVEINNIKYISQSVDNEGERLHILKRPNGKNFYHCTSNLDGYSKPVRCNNLGGF